MLLKDKVIIVSGVGPGMGQAMAKIAAKEGAKVGLGARNEEFLNSVHKEIVVFLNTLKQRSFRTFPNSVF